MCESKPSRVPRARRRGAIMSTTNAALSRRVVLQSNCRWPPTPGGRCARRVSRNGPIIGRPVRAERLHPASTSPARPPQMPRMRMGQGAPPRRHDPRRGTRRDQRRSYRAARQVYGNPHRHSGHRQIPSSIRAFWDKLAKQAPPRDMLIAPQLRNAVDAENCSASNSKISMPRAIAHSLRRAGDAAGNALCRTSQLKIRRISP